MLTDLLASLAFSRTKGKPRLVFLHLPRTGGTALAKDILFPNFPRSYWCHVNYRQDLEPVGGAHDPLRWTESRRGRVRLLAGHMPVDFAQYFPGPSEYVTLLRDPIARTISDYYFCRRNRTNPAHEAARKYSLIEFVERGHGLTHNCYARWLSNAIYGAVYRTDDEMLEAARKNLTTFAFVGITELFDASVRRICEKCGLTQYPLSSRNRNDATPRGKDVSVAARRVIYRHNELDRAIYEEFRKRFCDEEVQRRPARAETDTLERPAHT